MLSVSIRHMKLHLLLLLILLASCSSQEIPAHSKIDVSQGYLESTVKVLSNEIGARNLAHYKSLEEAKLFIISELESFGYQPIIQKYKVNGRDVSNVSVILGPENTERLVVGAHYDSFGDQVGADDNASGVSAILMLARLLKVEENKLKKQIELVAFTLEEPPFFRSTNMGSFVHANQLYKKGIPLVGMISVEMIGYYSEEGGSQEYPLPGMELIYPDKGDFIAVVSNFNSLSLKSAVMDQMKGSDLAVESLIAPESLAGVDFSDHLNYWGLGYKAVMVTDTAFFRNPHYHEYTDTPDKLNYSKMAKTIEGLYYAILNISIN
ncbi:M28 family peptidase [bacterium]|nr:M28 family peptidase [bacterium]